MTSERAPVCERAGKKALGAKEQTALLLGLTKYAARKLKDENFEALIRDFLARMTSSGKEARASREWTAPPLER